eukprot:m.96950 g.96950  ORF g.96950 m.96950 type:complete len:944 (+) comp12479_c1_seq2:59-2890(+)
MDEIIRRIQKVVVVKGVRVHEFFRDFDRLRTGKVSKTQFVRCIGQAGVYLSERDVKIIHRHYGKDEFSIDYKQFVDDIESVITTKGLEKIPNVDVRHAHDQIEWDKFEYSDENTESEYKDARDLVAHHCHKYGLSVKDIYIGFDKTNRGWVTVSQFERNLPLPPHFSESKIELIVNRFRRGDLANYAVLHKEIEGHKAEDPLTYRHTLRKPEIVEHATLTSTTTTNFDSLMKALQLSFLKTRVRPLEYFRDYDKLRSSFITQNQFECGLSLACSAPGGFRPNRSQVQVLVQHYKNDEGKINYRKFCKHVDDMLYTGKEEDLVNDPLAQLPVIKAKDIVVGVAVLDNEEDELRAQELLNKMRQRIDERGLDLYPQFRDVDRRSGFTKGVTWPQFQRLLDLTLSMNLSDYDVVLLCNKYNNPATGHINYMRFIADVDDLVNIPVAGEDEELFASLDKRKEFLTLKDIHKEEDVSDMEKTMKKIKHHVIEKSLRVSEALRDFDPLRKGLITPAQFKRGLATLAPHLSAGELNAVASAYTSASAPPPTTIEWRRFVSDMDHMHVPSHKLEATPTIELHDFDELRRKVKEENQESLEDRGLQDEDREVLDACLESVRKQAIELCLDLGAPFFAADPLRRGKLPPSKFARCLDMTRANVFPEDILLLQKFYTIQSGEVDYASFLRDVVPHEPEDSLTEQTLRNMQQTLNIRQQRLEDEEGGDVDEVLYRIEIQVVDRRIRLEEHFRGFDKLRKGYVSKPMFRSAMSMCNIGLTPAEYAALEEKYSVEGMPDKFRYTSFCSDVNEAFGTVDLHTNPTKDAVKRRAPTNIEIDQHLKNESEEQVKMRNELLDKIARKVRQRGISLIDDLEDYDKLHTGTVTVTQFQRVLSDLGLYDVSVSKKQFDAMCHKYLVGLRDVASSKLHYKSFVADIEELQDNLHTKYVSSFIKRN